MLQQHNEDRNDEAYNTKAPFRYECELALPEGSLPAMSILSLVVYCGDGVRPPVRLSSVSVAGMPFTWRSVARTRRSTPSSS